MVEIFRKDKVHIKIVFTTCKVMSYLSTKDPLQHVVSNLMLFILLYVLDVILVGRIHIHYNIRCGQHLGSDKNSSVFKHLAWPTIYISRPCT